MKKVKILGYVAYVYDENGNQIARISVFDKTKEEFEELIKSMFGEFEYENG